MGRESESSSTAPRTSVMLCATERACSLSPLISSCCPVPPGQSCGPMVLSPRSGKMRSPRCAGETSRCAPNLVMRSRLARGPPPEPPSLLSQGSARDQHPRGIGDVGNVLAGATVSTAQTTVVGALPGARDPPSHSSLPKVSLFRL